MRSTHRRNRLIAAVTSSAVGLVLFVALGGAGLAQSAIALAKSQYGPPGQYQYGKKVTICHKGKNTITISVNAWPAHQRHGDTEGPCAVQTAGAKKPKKVKTTEATASSTETSGGKVKKTKTTQKGSASATSEKGKPTKGKPTKSKPTKGKPAKGTQGEQATTTATTEQSDAGTAQTAKPKKPKKSKPAQAAPVAGEAGSPPSDSGPGNGKGKGSGNGKGKGKGKK